jgi:hypothetical protein
MLVPAHQHFDFGSQISKNLSCSITSAFALNFFAKALLHQHLRENLSKSEFLKKVFAITNALRPSVLATGKRAILRLEIGVVRDKLPAYFLISIDKKSHSLKRSDEKMRLPPHYET